LQDQYKTILFHYVAEGGEPDLELAYEFGRQAIDQGISVLEVVDAHYAALSEALLGTSTAGESLTIAQRATSLLKETLAPFEMTRLGYSETISLLRSQNDKLTKLIEERSQLLQQREDFMLVVTHDLKTPITAADRCLTLMLDGDFGEVTPDQNEVLSTMKDSNQRMFTMVKNLLEVYRYDQSKPILNLKRVDLFALINSVVKDLTLSAQLRNLRLKPNLPDNLRPVQADELAIRHVLTNLVDNAIKFTPRGGEITLAADNSGECVTVEVKDTGKGIGEEDIPRLFQRFFQTADGSKQYTGTGLGLYLCQQIVHSHGSEIECRSQLGVGTSFCFTLAAYEQSQITEKGESACA
jgi:signal transduction histidine kinase